MLKNSLPTPQKNLPLPFFILSVALFACILALIGALEHLMFEIEKSGAQAMVRAEEEKHAAYLERKVRGKQERSAALQHSLVQLAVAVARAKEGADQSDSLSKVSHLVSEGLRVDVGMTARERWRIEDEIRSLRRDSLAAAALSETLVARRDSLLSEIALQKRLSGRM